MRRYKSLLRTAGTLAMAFALAVSPVNAMAEELTGSGEQAGQAPVESEGPKEAKDGQYDTTKPELESVEFAQNGQTLEYTDEVVITVKAYDAEGDITVSANLLFAEDMEDAMTGSHNLFPVTFEKTGENTYTGKYSLEEVGYPFGAIYSLRVTDERNNYVDAEIWEDNVYKYSFNIILQDLGQMWVKDLTYDKDPGTVLKKDESVKINFRVEMEHPEYLENGNPTVWFENDNGNELEMFAWPDENGMCEVILTNYDTMQPGKWTLTGITFERSSMDKRYPMTVEGGMPDIYYTLEGELDTTAPVIEAVSIDRQGETLKAGDKVNIEIKASDETGLSEYASVELRPVGDVDVNEIIELTYADGVYKGQFEVTEDTYPCEWYIAWISISDKAGNPAPDNYWWNDSPYYFNVKNGNSFVAPEYTVSISFMALDANGEWVSVKESHVEDVPRRTTYEEAGITTPKVDSYPGLKLEGWGEYSGDRFDLGQEITDNTYMVLYAVYDKAPVTVTKISYDKEGYQVRDNEIRLVSKDMTKAEALKGLTDEGAPEECFPGLTFESWWWDMPEETDTAVGDRVIVSAYAQYDKGLVRFMTHDAFKDMESMIMLPDESEMEMVLCQVISENGQMVKLPGNATWVANISEEEIAAGEVMGYVEDIYTIYGYKGEGEPVKPEDPNEPAVTPPGTVLPAETVDALVNTVESLAEGESLTVDMGAATVVPEKVLEAVKGRDVDIQLKMDGYTWTINGKDVAASNLKDINLEVKLDTDAIPGKIVEELAGNDPAMQISLTHEGNFGFQATLTLNVGDEYAGKYGNLYWHDSDGKMVFIDAGLISADGNVSLVFSHASDYLIVMSEKADGEIKPGAGKPESDDGSGTGDEGETGSGNGTHTDNKADDKTSDDGAGAKGAGSKTVKTGDDEPLMIWFLLCAAAAGTVFAVCRRKMIR